jgi:hypothetical protein
MEVCFAFSSTLRLCAALALACASASTVAAPAVPLARGDLVRLKRGEMLMFKGQDFTGAPKGQEFSVLKVEPGQLYVPYCKEDGSLIAVSVPAGLNRVALKSPTTSPRCPRVHERHSRWKTMREWRALGIVPTGRGWPADDVQASLLEPDGPGKTAYLLTGNYRVILDYNCSNFYALSVGLLADEVER